MSELSDQNVNPCIQSLSTQQAADIGARVSKNAGAILVGRGFAIIFSLGASILLARYLGSEGLGQYASVYAYLALFSWLATFGFEPILIRDISRERDNASDLIHTGTIMSVLLSLGTVVIALVLSPIAGYTGFLRVLLFFAALEFAFIPFRLPGVVFQVDMRQWYGSAINVARQALWFAIVVFLWFYKASLLYVIIGRSVCALVEAALVWFYGRRWLSARKTFLWKRTVSILRQSFPLAFTSFVATIYLRIDQVMLHKMASDSILGQYAAAAKVSELFELLPGALMSSLAPILAVSVSNAADFIKYTNISFRYFMVLAAGLCVTLTLGAGFIVSLLFGQQFLPATSLLQVLIWSEIAVFFATIVVNILIAKNLQSLLPWPTAVGAALNIALNMFMIPKYAASGAAWATLISYTFAWMIFLLGLNKTRALIWPGIQFAIRTTGAALFAVCAVWFLGIRDFFGITFGIAIYLIGLWVTGMIRRGDLLYLREVLTRTLQTVRVA
jgi:O-antigen/teichoic acid export membrane protein